MLVGGSTVHPPTTPGLVHVSVVPPADPETVNVPLQDVPAAGLLIVIVNIPENELVVVDPPTLPLLGTVPPVVCHVPLTLAPLCVRANASGCATCPPAATVVNDIVPDHVPATLATEGADVEPPPHDRRRTAAGSTKTARHVFMCDLPDERGRQYIKYKGYCLVADGRFASSLR